jgi:hypothetical protein
MENGQFWVQLVSSAAIMLILGWLILGLKRQIKTQNEIIQAMGKKIEEMHKIEGLYRILIEDLPKTFENHKRALDRMNESVTEDKEWIIETLKNDSELPDEEIEQLRFKLIRYEDQQQDIQELITGFDKAIGKLNGRT